MWKTRQLISFVIERRASMTFVLGSLVYGLYHFFNTNIISQSNAYSVTDDLFSFINGRTFGLIFVFVSILKLYAILFDKVQMKLTLYFVLLSLWLVLGFGFFISFLEGYLNAAWIYCFTISAFSTGILSNSQDVKVRGWLE